MNTKNLIEGIQILQKYMKDKDGYHIGAGHEAIYFYKTDNEIDCSDLKRLIDLGWFQEDVEYDDEFMSEYYDPYASWCAYV